MRIPIIWSLLVMALFSSSPVCGQGVATGDLHVTVKNPNGSPVIKAAVIVRDEAEGVEWPASASGAGEYSVRALPPASYSVTVSAPGFATASASHLIITVGESAEMPIVLRVATAAETVELSSEADLVETARTSTTDTVNQRRIDNLPINGRNYINFTLTDSQVVRDNAPIPEQLPHPA
jgi:hypothetical protein